MSIEWTETPGPAVSFQCPRCGTLVSGTSCDRDEKIYVLRLIPTGGKTTTFVSCDNCKVTLISKLNIAELEDHKGADITPYVYFRHSLSITVLILAALLFFWIPVFGLILAAVITAATWKDTKGWSKPLSRIALALAILANVAFVLLTHFVK